MKSYNVDDKLKDPEIIKQAIIKTCKSKKKKKKGKNKKYKQAQYILKNIDKYVEKTLKIIIAFEKVQQAKEHGKKIDLETFRKAYKPKKCSSFITKENPSKKTRKITSAPLYPDQVIHQLVVLVAEPIFMNYMYEYSCGSVPGGGIHKGKRYIEKIIKYHRKHDKTAIKYAAKLDITKCYQSIPHKHLKEQLRKKFRGKLFLRLAFAIIDSYRDNAIDSEPVGLPIGYSTSHWFCNFLLTPLDYFIKQDLEVEYYVRYMDDIIFFGRNKREMHKAVKQITNFLDSIGLNIKDNYQVFRFDYIDKNGKRRGRDIDFIGYRFYRDKIILRKRNALKIRRQVKKISKMKEITPHAAQSLMSRLGWLRHCNSYNFWHKYVKSCINIKMIKEVIRIESRKQYQAQCSV